ncbi:hypothetical protein Y1Q_0009790 [Alligator mississippiensis]|uniref:Uncharacterized protein n=1 Tax=Alligator mississippiensis TaxID=8496 RepID=A0A151MWX3_ALLMI|nr:hypothetical protein Y1Q_0009790 [Alligator mississippiensis]
MRMYIHMALGSLFSSSCSFQVRTNQLPVLDSRVLRQTCSLALELGLRALKDGPDHSIYLLSGQTRPQEQQQGLFKSFRQWL